MSASKKLKAASGHAATTAPKDVKGKSKALPSPSDKMDMDERSDNDSDSSQSGADEDEDSDDGNSVAGSDDSMDTEDEIELAQQPTKSKQTLSASIHCVLQCLNWTNVNGLLMVDLQRGNEELFRLRLLGRR